MSLCLKIPGLPEWLCSLRKRGLFWINSAESHDRTTLLGQVLSGLSEHTQVTLVYSCEEANTLLSAYQSGPLAIRLFEIPALLLHKALRLLPSDLQRARAQHSELILLCLPAEAWAPMDEATLTHWCWSLRNWLEQYDTTLLICSQGPLHPQLTQLNDYLSGLSNLISEPSCTHYHIKYWHHKFGIQTEQKYCFERTAQGFEVLPETLQSEPSTSQDFRYLIQAHVLNKHTPIHDHWLVFDTLRDLLQQATSVPHGILLLGVANNEQIEDLAQQLHSQSFSPQQNLRILVRETAPCLRHRDRGLLQACGVHLIIPHNFPAPQIISFLELLKQESACTPEQLFDFQELKQSIDPPNQRGLISVQDFITTLEPIYAKDTLANIEHQLLQLTPSGKLTAEHCLNQMQLRRMGDVACIENESVYLFLFACNTNEIEQALQNICQLPFNSLFSKITQLNNLDSVRQASYSISHSAHIEEPSIQTTISQHIKPEVPLNPKRAKLPCISLAKK
ncbi:BcsE family c-di-GMP-binding protein [Azomonas agilis]|uniref:BcsE family c-di-GMP-binding protein n=1 Tax=Azomonas agilis TaxID=116849 RepID=UPI001FEC15A5|nr:BcsE family c-di-GMP-binding protein [Azomonas agilis]